MSGADLRMGETNLKFSCIRGILRTMLKNLYWPMCRKLLYAGFGLAAVILLGTVGYWFVGDQKYSLVDCLYMTIITIMTIGYGEIIDMAGKPAARIFTIFIAISGVGIVTFILTNLTAFIVAGEMSDAFRRRKMEKSISRLSQHYIICGVGEVGSHVLRELAATGRPHVIIDITREKIERNQAIFPDVLFIEGDATDGDVLLSAEIEKAKGLFAATGDDSRNLVIALTAKQLNPHIRVVAQCHDLRNMEKMKKAGADAVVSPSFIGGLRMASEMVRSTVVSFLDTMLRDKEKNLRVEEVKIPESFVGKPISALNLEDYPDILLLAVKTGKDWLYNPPAHYDLTPGNVLIVMTTPEELRRFESSLPGN
jgi:voltage-gated potassium channel